MSGFETAFGVVNTLLTALNSSVFKDALSNLPDKSKLKKLNKTVTAINKLLLAAEKKAEAEVSQIDRNYIQELKDAAYDADDLFDEIVTKAQLNQVFKVGKVRKFFKQFGIARRVNTIIGSLDAISDDRAKFGLGIGTQPHRRTRVETFSYVSATTVVGRDEDASKVIGMLLDSEMCVYFFAIVGIGGLGKTTLAKLVFGDTRITAEFPVRLWVCVSDQDGATLDARQILLKILESLECQFDNTPSIDFLQREYQRKLQGNNFLLVLDDIWSEKIVELHKLKELLKIDGSTSRIITTTRSKVTAKIMGNGTHELEGLSIEHSQSLFEKAAFEDGQKPPELVEIGEKIVNKSSNVPLALMVIGRLLHGQPIDKWRTFETSGFSTFSRGKYEIMSILEISYDNLDPSLKNCFAYCAIFPKDYVICKETIINLWEAQGYIVPFDADQSIENAGEEHFSVLLQRCFFQEVEKDEFGDVFSFKLHDLMHDLAQRVSGKEIISVINSSMRDLECSVRHLGVSRSVDTNIPTSEYNLHHRKIKLRSYLICWGSWEAYLENEFPRFELPTNWGCLRALAVQRSNVKRLSDKIGNLLHLRYLNLAHSRMKKLPDSIVKLHNLQTLNMNKCVFLDEWPKEFSKLVNLTHLYVDFCYKLSCMPVGMSKLSRIRRLTNFMVEDESASGVQRVGQLSDLKAIAMNLKGSISIHFKENLKSTEGRDWDESILEGAKYLDGLKIIFCCFNDLLLSEPYYISQKGGKDEVVMNKLKPHPNLRKFDLSYYNGEIIANWGRAQDNWATFLPNLVHIQLHRCHNIGELPVLSKLRHLRTLSLTDLRDLDYMEEELTSSSYSGSLDTTFFPSLESLTIELLENLKRWWKYCDCDETHCHLAFPNLSQLSIAGCHSLISFPHCLSLPVLDIVDNNPELRITTMDGVHTSS